VVLAVVVMVAREAELAAVSPEKAWLLYVAVLPLLSESSGSPFGPSEKKCVNLIIKGDCV